MHLKIDRPVFESIVRAARRAAPLEACGLCGGTAGQVTRFYELTNADASGEHYRMLPEEQFAAVKNMRTHDSRLLAIWHSHPATPARMSDEDLRLAFTPETVYLIVSLAVPSAPDLRGFTLHNGQAETVELTLVDCEKNKDTP
jgi:proteasome lid subunit RPN8/RPN11